ncbi:MAG: ABC transporter ATP-binding protein [Deltaproteobacteria bacterium]|nr:ABC transporter ATP-binding protein [Deltaproteobacteria bacterium]
MISTTITYNDTNISIAANHLTRCFGSFTAVNDVSFTVQKGEIFGYLGANGAGKSTTIRMLIGLLSPSSGSGRVAGFDIATNAEMVKRKIGYMSQKFSLYLDLPVRENFLFFGQAYGLSGRELNLRWQKIIELIDLVGHENEITGSLPGGMRQRLALGCAILHRPEIVFLDEPTAGVDPVARRIFWRLIRELSRQKTTVFVTTHYLDEAEYCQRIGLMIDGRLAALDTPTALKQTYVPGRVLVVRGRGLLKAMQALQNQKGIIAVTPFGAGLHLRVRSELWNTENITKVLHNEGASQIQIDETEATLEDVFLEVVGSAKAT